MRVTPKGQVMLLTRSSADLLLSVWDPQLQFAPGKAWKPPTPQSKVNPNEYKIVSVADFLKEKEATSNSTALPPVPGGSFLKEDISSGLSFVSLGGTAVPPTTPTGSYIKPGTTLE